MEKIASGLGSIVKIIVYGFILLVIAGMVLAFNYSGSKPTEKKPAEVSKIDQQAIKQESGVVENKTDTTKVETQPTVEKEQTKEEPATNPLESKISLEVTKITGENYNDIAKAYSGIGLGIKVSNNSDQVIQGIKGEIIIIDAFGDVAGTFNFKEDTTMKPGTTKKHEFVYKANLFNTKQQKIIDIKKWTTTFKAEKILVD